MSGRLRQRLNRTRAGGRERGAGGEALGLVIGAPIILVIFLIIVAAGRFEMGQSKIDGAAGAAARAASLQTNSVDAQKAAQAAATQSLTGSGVTCQGSGVQINLGGFDAPAAPGAAVVVTVTCEVNWSDLTIPGWPGQKPISSTASSAIDRNRAGT